LNFIFLKKSHIKTYETKIFGYLILANMIGLIIELLTDYSVHFLGTDSIITIILSKLLLCYFLTFVFLFLLYVLLVSFGKTENNKIIIDKNLFNRTKKILLAFYVISILWVIILPIKLFFLDKIAYSYGPSTQIVYFVSGLCVLICLLVIFKNKKNIFSSKKYIPLIVFIVGGIIATIIQKIYPELTLASSMETYLTLIMYFTIENPDMKLINELNIAKDQAVQANNAKSDFLSSMSHEIRTPLNAIVGFSESLKEEELPAQARGEVNDIIDASNTLLEIVNGILDISKIEANRLEIVNTEYNFSKIFNELVALAKARLGESKPIDFRYHLAPDVPEVLYGDYARIKQIILNLLTNAIKYTNEGYIDFNVSSLVNGNVCRLIISVEDSGIGIKKESINKLFTKFERLEEKNTTIEGTGLGLAITKKLVEMMNGKIIVQSVYGKGSKFTTIIDQRIVAIKAPVVTPSAVKVNTVLHDFRNKKVLVVDDNSLNLKVAARLLKSYECQVEEVDSGFKCLDLIASNSHYDLILMDDMMPKMSGTDTLHRLKENPTFKMPVVALTANAISGMKEKYLADGFDDYLAKPIEKAELTAIINKYLG
jgi:signal transduction histidine kinase/CheY-like chemotaxis protein